ncbi:hypothetical protein O6H91_17G001500 [Diphasiastrum complanatum]|uniref:Uncharacterized protein n=1 Tax=Diphasiastrum complanatum TaxID=34168 RepID=A0ACC2B3P9_DIPCM|nr:hypothetical protein O6H91_17G001500 [Diphasiastrum complanatum]
MRLVYMYAKNKISFKRPPRFSSFYLHVIPSLHVLFYLSGHLAVLFHLLLCTRTSAFATLAAMPFAATVWMPSLVCLCRFPLFCPRRFATDAPSSHRFSLLRVMRSCFTLSKP